MSNDVITNAAADLWAAHRDRKPIGPLTKRYPDLNVAAAYDIQQVNLCRRLAAGAKLVGRKIGLTSAPMQTLLGVEEPDYGFILDDMVTADGSTVPASRFCAPRVEPEVAFLMRRTPRGPNVTVAEVHAATEAIAVALEIVDSRIANWELTLADTVADNASSGAVVLGDWVDFDGTIDLPATQATLQLNGVDVDTGSGSAVLGDPAAAVAWLANALAPYGTEITAGQFVMSGSYTTAAFVRRGDAATATISGLGSVTLHFG
jgi:2-keto-4-pentenoate hydratase